MASGREAFARDNNDFACAMYGQLRQSPAPKSSSA